MTNIVLKLIIENESAGVYEATFSSKQYTSGVYFYKITAGEFNIVKKMIFIK